MPNNALPLKPGLAVILNDLEWFKIIENGTTR